MLSNIIIKTPEQIKGIRAASKVLGELFAELKTFIKPGTSTYQIDKHAEKFIRKHGGFPTFKHVPGYDNATCISVNNEIVHGIPRKSKIIERGDILSVDCGVTLNGLIGDATECYIMPGASDNAKKLVEVTRKCLELGIAQAKPGNHIGDIGNAVQTYAESFGYGVIREYVGHGTGVNLHEEPSIPHYGNKGEGEEILEGMVIAIEPMINEGTHRCKTLKDGWTVVTADGKLSAQVEHTIAITADGPVVMTVR